MPKVATYQKELIDTLHSKFADCMAEIRILSYSGYGSYVPAILDDMIHNLTIDFGQSIDQLEGSFSVDRAGWAESGIERHLYNDL